MRTNIEIDDRLMREAMKSSGTKTKRATVEEVVAVVPYGLAKQIGDAASARENTVGRQSGRTGRFWPKH